MSTSRRDFLKTTAIVGTGVAIDGLSAIAQPAAQGSSSTAQTHEVATAPEYTRGIGLYPGAPSENFSPDLIPDTTYYRNLALLRPAYHSSSYDYNLTAQLVTDGIKDTPSAELDRRLRRSSRSPTQNRNREVIVDHAPMNTMEMHGATAYVDIRARGGEGGTRRSTAVQLFVVSPSQASRGFAEIYDLHLRRWAHLAVRPEAPVAPKPASTAGYPPDFCAPNHFFTPSIPLNSVSRSRFYRVECSTGSGRSKALGKPDVAGSARWHFSRAISASKLVALTASPARG